MLLQYKLYQYETRRSNSLFDPNYLLAAFPIDPDGFHSAHLAVFTRMGNAEDHRCQQASQKRTRRLTWSGETERERERSRYYMIVVVVVVVVVVVGVVVVVVVVTSNLIAMASTY